MEAIATVSVLDDPPAPSSLEVGTRGARIVAENVTLRHGNGTIGLDDISLTLEPGQLTAVSDPAVPARARCSLRLPESAPRPKAA